MFRIFQLKILKSGVDIGTRRGYGKEKHYGEKESLPRMNIQSSNNW